VRWLRLDAGWRKSGWIYVLSTGSQLAWIELLCYVKLEGVGGKVKAMAPMVASKVWGVGYEDVDKLLTAAVADGALVIEDGHWTIVNWSKFQEPDSTAAERKRRQRERQKERHASHAVTPVTDGVTRHATETETETETRDTPPTPLPGELVCLPGFVETWADWERHRSEKRQRLTPTARSRQLAMLVRQPDPVACLNQSIQNGWTGLFEVKAEPGRADHDPYAGVPRAGAG